MFSLALLDLLLGMAPPGVLLGVAPPGGCGLTCCWMEVLLVGAAVPVSECGLAVVGHSSSCFFGIAPLVGHGCGCCWAWLWLLLGMALATVGHGCGCCCWWLHLWFIAVAVDGDGSTFC